jgi:DNA-binding phage protein
MNEQENNKANAAILLSADEAVEKKIVAILVKNPQLIQNALDTIERERMAHQAQQYQNALGQSMMNTKNAVAQNMLNSTHTTGNTNPLGKQGYWQGVFGGRK